MYKIEITYSWGDCESDITGFKTREEAFHKACQMAGEEAYVQNEEFDPERTCEVSVDAAAGTIILRYDHDDTTCTYAVKGA